MRLFLREQLPLFFTYIAQLFTVLFVFWIDGYQNISIILYAVILSVCILTGYLIYRYLTHRTFYKRLEKPREPLEEFSHDGSGTPLAKSLQELLQNQHRQYRSDLHNYQQKLKDHIQFINQWVHQMKTPLSVIHLMIQSEDDPRFAAIADELDRMKKGLELVLYTARLDELEHDFYVESLPLEQVVRTVTSAQKRLFIRKRVFPAIEINKELTITSDEKWLTFVITQVMTNAVRYTNAENKKIYIRGYKRGMNVVLEIEDEGVGIVTSDILRVFDPYFTGENGRIFQESTGMGLYLVKQICDKLGHRVEIESIVNQGTTVRFLF